VSFARPEVLVLLAFVPVAVALFVRASRKRAAALRLFLGAAHTGTAPTRWGIRAALQCAALALVVVALAGPLVGTTLTESRSAGVDLVVALDVSASMNARDIAPSRLERARFLLARLAEQRSSDRLALVVFSADAALLSPLTRDAAAFRMYLDAVGPEIVGTAGSEPSRALSVAASAFDVADAGRPRAILIVSDGENPNAGPQGDGAAELADDLRRAGVDILALAVGGQTGSTIPLPNDRVLRDRDGEVVRTALDADALAALAERDVYLADEDPLPAIVDRLDELAGAGASLERVPAAAERYQWPLALAIALLVFDRVVAAWAGRRRPRGFVDAAGLSAAPI
jgi:Ca-activated chloride channel family protein